MQHQRIKAPSGAWARDKQRRSGRSINEGPGAAPAAKGNVSENERSVGNKNSKIARIVI